MDAVFSLGERKGQNKVALLVDLIERANRNITYADYKDAEDFYLENVPSEFLALTFDGPVQEEIAAMIVDHVNEAPDRGDLLWVLGKMPESVALKPLVRLWCMRGCEFDDSTAYQAHIALQNMIWSPPSVGYSLAEVLGADLAGALAQAVKSTCKSESDDVRRAAATTRLKLKGVGLPLD